MKSTVIISFLLLICLSSINGQTKTSEQTFIESQKCAETGAYVSSIKIFPRVK